MDEKKIYKVINKLIVGKELYLLRDCFGNYDKCLSGKINIKKVNKIDHYDNLSNLFYLDCLLCKKRSEEKNNAKKD